MNTTDAEGRLAQIRALHRAVYEDGTAVGCAVCDWEQPGNHVWPCATVRVLDAAPVAATPQQGIDRDALEAIADLHLATGAGWKDEGRAGFIEHVRAILAKVGPPTIDRGALLELLREETGWDWNGEQDEPAPIFGCDTRVPSSEQMLAEFADRILALVRPVDGVTITREEAQVALVWWDVAQRYSHLTPWAAHRALAACLEAAQ